MGTVQIIHIKGGDSLTNIWNDAVDQRLKELRKTLSQEATAERLSEEFGYNYTRNAVKNREGRIPGEVKTVEKLPEYKENIEIKSDGSQISDKLIELSEKEMKDTKYILLAHGYDPSKWEIINVKISRWHYRDKQSENAKISYATKLAVKPKQNTISIETLLEAIRDIKPIHIDTKPVKADNGLLEIPLFDTHFGISDYEHYKPTQNKIMNLLSKQWKEVLFIIGQDLLHHDNFRSTTASGTAIEQVDFAKAWEDARKMYEPMIEKAIQRSMNVKICYSKGNHDESMSWAFVQMLKAKYPQCQFDDAITERKAHTFGKVFIGITHGDKARKNLHNLFPVEFPLEWSQAKTRELHTGHYHKEDANDIYGMMVRTLATRNKTDQWHKDNGFVGAHKRFMLFEYSEEELESIHYV